MTEPKTEVLRSDPHCPSCTCPVADPEGVVVGHNAAGEACCAKCGEKDYPLIYHRCKTKDVPKEAVLVGQEVAPGIVAVHENTLSLLKDQADAKNDLRQELHKAEEGNKERDKVLVEADSHLSAIVHRFSTRLPEDFIKDIQGTLGKVQKYSRP